MKKSNFLMIFIVLVIVFGSWLVAQTVLVSVKNSRDISGTDTYDGIKEERGIILKNSSSSIEYSD